MRKIPTEERDKICERMANHLGVDNVIIVYGDHIEGKIDVMMCAAKGVDMVNFGENGIGAIQGVLKKIGQQGQQVTKSE